jgi:hypothetical protein
MTRAVVAARTAVVALALAIGSTVAALDVAELSIVSYGAQLFDLATGFTELPDGGEIVDRGTGIRLTAPWLRYADGVALEAHDAVVEAPFGRLLAPKLVVDLQRSRLEAEGGITLELEGAGTVLAQRLIFASSDGWVVARGDVVADDPVATAAAVWADTASGRIVLEAPYRYEDGPLVLRSDEVGSRLQLTPSTGDDGVVLGYDASTTLDADVLARLETDLE